MNKLELVAVVLPVMFSSSCQTENGQEPDRTPPTIANDTFPAQALTVGTTTLSVSVTFSEPVSGVSGGVNVSHGAFLNVSGSGAGPYKLQFSALANATSYAVDFSSAIVDRAGMALTSTARRFSVSNRFWTRTLGTATNDIAYAVAVDSGGSIYAAGETSAALDGQPFIGQRDLFLVKFDSSGTKQWTRTLGTATNDVAYDVAVDSGGSIYAVGETSAALDGQPYVGETDLFVAKYDSTGTKQWVRTLGSVEIGSSQGEEARGVAVDGSGNVYAVGSTTGILDGQPNASANSGVMDLFVIKYDSDGAKQWTRTLGSLDDDLAHGVAVYGSSDIYVVGYTQDVLDGQPFVGGTTDLFVVKYDSNGTKQWTRTLGTTGDEAAVGVAVDGSGDVYVAGRVDSPLDGQLYAGGEDMFLVKYDSSGTKQWTRTLGTVYDEEARDVAVDADDNVYVVVSSHGTLDGQPNVGDFDQYLVKYDATGARQWTHALGTSGIDFANGVAVDPSGNAYCAGKTTGALDGQPYAGAYDMFLVKWSP